MIEHPILPPRVYGMSLLDVESLLPERDALPDYAIRKIPDSIVSFAMTAKQTFPNIFWVPVHGEDTCFGHGVTTHLVLRPMTRNEFETFELLKQNDITFNESTILDRCILMPSGLSKANSLPAGHVETAYKIIRELSGWFENSDMIELQNYYRDSAQTSMMTVFDMISRSAFGGISNRDMKNMDAHETLEIVSMAETMLGLTVDVDPDKAGKKQKQKIDKIIKRVNLEEENRKITENRTAEDIVRM